MQMHGGSGSGQVWADNSCWCVGLRRPGQVVVFRPVENSNSNDTLVVHSTIAE